MTLTQTPSWIALQTHYQQDIQAHHLLNLRSTSTTDSENDLYQSACAGIHLDYSRQYINQHSLDLWTQLLESPSVQWRQAQARMYQGDIINHSENRQVLHVALRGSYMGNDAAIRQDVEQSKSAFLQFAEDIRAGRITGATGKSITDVVNLGIGGSDLGPRMVCHALTEPHHPDQMIGVHFVANMDPDEFERVTADLSPEHTLFIVSSKSFSTTETQMNAQAALAWLRTYYQQSSEQPSLTHIQAQHFCAITNQIAAATEWGFAPERLFGMPQWAGGRFSLWSAIGLPIAVLIGRAGFEDLLAGAAQMDSDFVNQPLKNNLPALHAILGVWNTHFLGANTHGVISYSERLRYFADYLQQLEMESNGKSINQQGEHVDYPTAPVLFGGLGSSVQHSFFQALHQGTQRVPLDIITVGNNASPKFTGDTRREDLALFARAQADTLAYGVQALPDSIRQTWLQKPSYSHFAAGQPSSLLHIAQLDARTLGALIALYEHKTFLQGVIWQINSFDQWGVELGKVMFNALKQQNA